MRPRSVFMSHNLWLSIAPTHGHVHVHHISLTVWLNINCVHLYGLFLVFGWLILNFWGRSYSRGQGFQSPCFGLPSAMIAAWSSSPGWFLHCSVCLSLHQVLHTQYWSASVYFLPNLLLVFSMAIPFLFHIDFSSTVGVGEMSCWKLVEITASHLFVETWSFHCCLSAGAWLASQIIYAFFPLLGVLKALAHSSIHSIRLYLIFHFIKDLCFCPCTCVLMRANATQLLGTELKISKRASMLDHWAATQASKCAWPPSRRFSLRISLLSDYK